jgi:hypothetical protein
VSGTMDHDQLRQLVAEDKTNQEIAALVGTSSRTVRRALKALGLERGPGRPQKGRTAQIAIKVTPEDRDALHALAQAAGAPSTTDWILGLLEGAELAAVVRDPSLPREERRVALAELLDWLAGPEERGPVAPSEEG